MIYIRPIQGRLSVVLLMAAAATSVTAAPWRLDGTLSVRETYTNNVTLNSDSGGQSALVTTVQPRFTLSRTRPGRLNLRFVYAPQFRMENFFQQARVNQRLSLISDAELVRERVFVDFTSTITQQNLLSTGTLATDTVSRTDNLTTRATYTISPYYRNRFGSFADAEVRFRTGGVFFDSRGAQDTNRFTFSGVVNSGTRFSLTPWDIVASVSQNRNSGATLDETQTFRRVEGTLGARWSRKFLPFASVGYDNDDFLAGRRTEGFRWSVGATYTPNPRTELTLGYRDTYFGDTPFFDLSYRGRRFVLQAGFDTELATSAAQALVDPDALLIDEFGDPIEDRTGIPIDNVSTVTPDPISDPFVVKRFDATIATVTVRRTSLSASGFWLERDYEITGEENAYGASLRASRSLSRRTTVIISAGWTPRTFRTQPGREDTRWTAQAGVTRQFGRDLSGSLDYRFQQNDSNLVGSAFTEHRVSARVAWNFW